MDETQLKRPATDNTIPEIADTLKRIEEKLDEIIKKMD